MVSVLSKEGFIIKGIEVVTLSFVGELGGVADGVSSDVVPSVIIVPVHSLLIVKHMNEYVFFLGGLLQVGQSFYQTRFLVESGSENKGLVSVLSSVGKDEFVLVRQVLGDSGTDIRPRPSLNLGGNSSRLELQRSNVSMSNTEVSLGQNILSLFRNEGHFIVDTIVLQEFGEGSCIIST